MDDSGYFKVNKPLTGDFVVIGRFKGTGGEAEGSGGGAGAHGVLFRYVNHTCFLPDGDQVSLRKNQVGRECVVFAEPSGFARRFRPRYRVG